ERRRHEEGTCSNVVMDLWFEWREENNDERFSFEDSDRFEEDSLCSWASEPESICANWRGWKRSSQNSVSSSSDNVDSLMELCAKTVANYIPFEAVEQTYPQIPEQIQLRIAFWSFPKVEDDIRLYSCLANGSPDEFQRGEHLLKAKAVRDALQIGFHLSAMVNQQHSSVLSKGMFSVAVTFDRGHITSCNCTCYPSATWCAHIIALCLLRIHHPDQVCLRAPVSEYLSRLRRDQLQKFAQYLISELPQQILPTAQRLLDELLSSQESAINTVSGAPDPTAGPSMTDHNKWCLDEKALRENVRKMLVRFCGPVPLVFNDVSGVYMSNTAPPTAAEWSNLLRPLKGREPEGMWNLLYIVRELFHRRDSNAINLLSTLTEECLANDQVVIWWFDSRSQASGSSVHRNHGNGYRNNTNAASTEATKHACAGFCDELVVLWRLAALNPKLDDEEREDSKIWLNQWHQDAVDKARAGHGAGFQAAVSCFPGFHPAIEACSLAWGNVNLSSDTEKPEGVLDVKLAHQETELVALLRKLPLRGEEMMVVREKANLIWQGKLQRGGAVLPIMLATFIFEVLCCPGNAKKKSNNEPEKKVDEDIGYKAAFCALGMRPNILETDYPILCEGIRRQRGDLAIAVLDYCKDNPSRLKAVKEVLLDKTRYEGPSFVSEVERQNDTRQNENEKKKSEDNVNARNRGGFGLPPRRGSNSQSSSNTSDSGTDNGSRGSCGGQNRPRGRPTGGKTQPKITVTVNEVRREEESGSSSGVDTDSAVNHPSPSVTAKVVGVCHGDPRNTTNVTRASNFSAQGTLGPRNGPRDGETRDRNQMPCSPRRGPQQANARATSDLEGSDIEDGNEELAIESGGVALAPDNSNISDKLVQEIALPLNRSESGKITRRDSGSSSSEGRDAGVLVDNEGGSLSDSSPVILSPSSSSANVSSEGSSCCDAPKSKSAGRAQGKMKSKSSCDVTFKTEGLPSDPTRVSDSGVRILGFPVTCAQNSESLAKGAAMSAIQSDSSRTSKEFELRGGELESLDEELESLDEEFESRGKRFDSRDEAVSLVGASNSQDGLPMATLSLLSPGQAAASNGGPEDTSSGCVQAAGTVGEELEAVAGAADVAEAGASVNADDIDANHHGRNRRQGNKKSRRKKKGKNSAVNQATEAEAHFMFELAKTVLTRAGGISSTSVFSQPATTTSHGGPHRGLQLCAFEIGLFALGLHNRTSVNWLSRTYSSHVSWISGQAMEIGSTAIQLLIERWESNLTPSEVASIADRASRSNDPTMVRAAAELGLSCLHMAHTLNPGEIQRALLQCRDEDTQLLDRACQAVESAARGGGVYPEVLFDVARHWHYLHEQSQTTTSRSHKDNSRNRGSQTSRAQQQQPSVPSSTSSVNLYLHSHPLDGHSTFNSVPPPPYLTAEQYVQTQMHHQVQHLMNQGSYNSGTSYRPNNQASYGYSFNSRQLHANQFQISSSYGGLPPPYQTSNPAVCQLSSRALNQQQGGQVSYYLNNAYRVGMLALESLARRTPDDRPNVKYSRNPPCSDDIRWLCSLSARLGTSYLHRFCVSALNAVVSPFVLHDLALEAARHLARSNPGQLAVNLRSPNISPLVQKSLSMYGQCIHHNLMVMAQSDHEDFVELLRHARGAFCMVPGGMSQFNELLQSIRRLYPKKKDLWQKIMTGLAKA
ncbi:hypothetical protein QZH41_010056, partial [Actinostola sp. cb2023]